MIIGCEHHTGMGLCSACSAEVSKSVDRDSDNMRRRRELLDAAEVAERNGMPNTAAKLRRKADGL